MFVNKLSHISRAHISKRKRCFDVQSLTYYFHAKTKILADFQICISVPLKIIRQFRDIDNHQLLPKIIHQAMKNITRKNRNEKYNTGENRNEKQQQENPKKIWLNSTRHISTP